MNQSLQALHDIVHLANNFPDERRSKEAKDILLWLIETQQENAIVRVCNNKGCGKFVIGIRSGRKKFCSTYCRVTGNRDPKRWNAYMREYRNKRR